MLKSKKIAITGGAGYLGLRLACALASQNDVLLLDIREAPQALLPPTIRFLPCDVLDRAALVKAFQGVDVVFHRAGVMGNLNSLKDPELYYQINVEGTMHVLEAARINEVKRFLFDSTEAVYGSDVRSPVTEVQTAVPGSIYGATKLIAEDLIRMYDNKYGLSTLIFRYSRTRDATKRDAILILAEKILRGDPLTLYNDGVPVIDFCDVDDLIAANILGACSDLRNTALNISSGEGISFLDMVRSLQNALGREDSQIIFQQLGDFPPVSEFQFGPVVNFMSIAKAKEHLGWSPRTSILDSIRQSAQFALEQQRAVP